MSRHVLNRDRCKFSQTKKQLASSRVPELGAGTRFMHKNLMTIIISKSITTTSQSQQQTNHAQINFLTYTYLGKKKRKKLSAAPPTAVSWRSCPRRPGRTAPAGTRRGRAELLLPPGLAGRASRRSRPDPGRASRRSRPEPGRFSCGDRDLAGSSPTGKRASSLELHSS